MTENSSFKRMKKLATDAFIFPCFSPKTTLYSTFTEQTAWYPWVSMDWKVPARKRGLYAHLAENMAFGEKVQGREGTSRPQAIRYLQDWQPPAGILHISNTGVSVLPEGEENSWQY